MNASKSHKLSIDQRKSIAVAGVLDVISFDENAVVCETDMGILVMRGAGLNIASLNLDSGSLAVNGSLDSIHYEESRAAGRKAKGAFKKIFK